MLIDEGNIHKKIGLLSLLATEKIAFPPKPDRRTDISVYRVASLLKRTDFVRQFFIRFLIIITLSKAWL